MMGLLVFTAGMHGIWQLKFASPSCLHWLQILMLNIRFAFVLILFHTYKLMSFLVSELPGLCLLQPSPFFSEQLTAFEVWLDHGSEHKKPPEQLPIVLQV